MVDTEVGYGLPVGARFVLGARRLLPLPSSRT